MSYSKSKFINPLHLVTISPWPLGLSFSLFGLTFGSILWWHKLKSYIMLMSFILTLILSYCWWSDVSFEKIQGNHNSLVLSFFRFGMLLFILSEMLFFFSFFWGFFHNCWNPKLEVGCLWPPYNFLSMIIDPFSVPLLKTILLLSSGASMTLSHHYILFSNWNYSVLSLMLTMMFGSIFLMLQLFEYSSSILSINSSVYGSSFFLLTGFHGLHVIIGTIFLFVSLGRLFNSYYSSKVHSCFELSAWYWHFVDVVWLFLYFFMYWYGFMM